MTSCEYYYEIRVSSLLLARQASCFTGTVHVAQIYYVHVSVRSLDGAAVLRD